MSFIRSRKNCLEEISGVLFSKGAPAPHEFTHLSERWEPLRVAKNYKEKKMAGNKDENQ